MFAVQLRQEDKTVLQILLSLTKGTVDQDLDLVLAPQEEIEGLLTTNTFVEPGPPTVPPSLPEGNHHGSDGPVGARLFRFKRTLRESYTFSIVQKGLSWSWTKHPPRLKRLHQKVCPAISEYVKEMLAKRVVEKAKRPIKWQSRLFTVP